jgi:hypothetical protein
MAQISSAMSTSLSVGAPKDRPFERRLAHRLDDRRVGVAEDQPAPGADVVDVLLAVRIPHPGAFGRAKKRGVPPTERKARTGELTPPGMLRWAREFEEGFVCGIGRARRHRAPPSPAPTGAAAA